MSTGRALSWPIEEATDAIDTMFSSMRTDIILERRDQPGRLVIDTTFTSIFGKGWYHDQSLRTGTIYQLYAYLRCQEGQGDPWAEQAAGMLLRPAIHAEVEEAVRIHGHRMRFATVDLAGQHTAIRQRLLQLVDT